MWQLDDSKNVDLQHVPIASDTFPQAKLVSTVTENTYKLSTKALGESANFNKEWDIPAHAADGGLRSFYVSQLSAVGLRELLARLQINRPFFLSSSVLITLWLSFLTASACLVHLAFKRLSDPSGEPVPPVMKQVCKRSSAFEGGDIWR